MSAAALFLAAALVALPATSRHRLSAVAGLVRSPRRPPLLLYVAVGFATLAVFAPVSLVAALGVAVMTIGLRLRQRAARRQRSVEAGSLQGALDVLVGELRVGAHPVTAIGVAAIEAQGTVAVALATVAARARLGADVAAGLEAAGRQSALPAYWGRLAVCWQLAEAHGMAIAALVHAAQRDIVERERFAERVDAGMAGARTTAVVLTGLPVLGVVLGQLIGAHPMAFLLGGGVGGWLLVIGVMLGCAGLLWSDRITGRAAT